MTALTDAVDASASNPVTRRGLAQYADARVLVIDDNLPSASLVQATLRRAGLIAVEALTEAAQAVSTIRRYRPDLVLLDLHMPEVDGYEILAELREADPGVDVLVLTADTTRVALQRAFELGARDFLTKPVDPTELALRVGSLLHVGELHRLLRLREQWTDASAEIARSLTLRDAPPPGQLISDLARSVADAELAVYRPANEETDPPQFFASSDATAQPVITDINSLLWALRALDDGRPRLLGTMAGDDAALDHGANVMVIPLATARSHVGILGLQRAADARPFTALDLELATDFGRRLSMDVELADAEMARRGYEIVEERHRVARNLHDQVIQRLFAIGIQIEGAAQSHDVDLIRDRLAARVRDLNETIDLIRTTVFNPPRDSSDPPSGSGEPSLA